ncbi:hypothetical protein CDL12_24016 [Handroanthus impetiginosus]|uniref:Uncharacterized protein n=1 Tax=Handroanthus impetiginosus TaxID=429701 RepID=A0A2G9GDV5_9LAMI|nr:hypothetical protein CDL12_24016 [Handroanthus impetiginosus]
MGRQNEDPSVVGSSIVLLQERFKQLQRLKEMRQERQLLKLLNQSRDGADAVFQDPLALGLNSNAHFQQFSSSGANVADRGPQRLFEKSDVVDTSLHL